MEQFLCIFLTWYMINPQVTCWTFFQELREELQRLKDQATPNHQVSDLKFIAKFLGLPKYFFAQWPWPLVNYIILLDFQINYPVSFMCAYGAFKQKHTAYSRGLSVLLWWLTGNVVWRWLISLSGCCTNFALSSVKVLICIVVYFYIRIKWKIE